MNPKVHTVEDPVRQVYVVYVEINPPKDEDDFEARWYRTPEGIVKVATGAEPPAYTAIDTRIAHALAGVLQPRPHATEAHLTDAIGVRDRLLTLVEAGATIRP